jgi:predicted transcriptional regulator
MPKPFVGIRLRREILEALDGLAAKYDVPRTLLIKRAIELFLKSENIDLILLEEKKVVEKSEEKTSKTAEKAGMPLAKTSL